MTRKEIIRYGIAVLILAAIVLAINWPTKRQNITLPQDVTETIELRHAAAKP